MQRNAHELTWSDLNVLACEIGDSFYIFDESKFNSNFSCLLSLFRQQYRDTYIGYSYKTNYTPRLCQLVQDLGGFAEVVSEMEYQLAEQLGVPNHRIIFNGPLKSKNALERALLNNSLVNLDSMRDINILEAIASENLQCQINVGLRCNFPLRAGFISRFGFDVEGEAFRHALAKIIEMPNVSLHGLHCHFPDRDLNSFNIRASKMITLANSIFEDKVPNYLNIGGGFFSSMPEHLKSTFKVDHVDFESYAEVVGRQISKNYASSILKPNLFIEPGTALVADTLVFFARVIDQKRISNRNFATVYGSIFNISASARKTNLPVRVINKHSSPQNDNLEYDIVGYTCIEGDILSTGFKGAVNVDDFVAYSNVGSYSIVMKPPFIMPNVPIISLNNESFVLLKRKEYLNDLIATFRI